MADRKDTPRGSKVRRYTNFESSFRRRPGGRDKLIYIADPENQPGELDLLGEDVVSTSLDHLRSDVLQKLLDR